MYVVDVTAGWLRSVALFQGYIPDHLQIHIGSGDRYVVLNRTSTTLEPNPSVYSIDRTVVSSYSSHLLGADPVVLFGTNIQPSQSVRYLAVVVVTVSHVSPVSDCLVYASFICITFDLSDHLST